MQRKDKKSTVSHISTYPCVHTYTLLVSFGTSNVWALECTCSIMKVHLYVCRYTECVWCSYQKSYVMKLPKPFFSKKTLCRWIILSPTQGESEVAYNDKRGHSPFWVFYLLKLSLVFLFSDLYTLFIFLWKREEVLRVDPSKVPTGMCTIPYFLQPGARRPHGTHQTTAAASSIPLHPHVRISFKGSQISYIQDLFGIRQLCRIRGLISVSVPWESHFIFVPENVAAEATRAAKATVPCLGMN
jgi:hypothetical protein